MRALKHEAQGTARGTRHAAHFPTVHSFPPSNPPVTDAELVERARAGDDEAFCALVERYQHLVVRAAISVVGRREEAEDVAQEAFVRAYRGLARFRGDASVKTWLLTITWREALSQRRSIAARLRRLVTPRDDQALDPPAGGRRHDIALEDREFAALMAKVIRSLPARSREALMLAATGDFSYDEMSEALGVPAGTLKWRVSDARRRVREKLERLGVMPRYAGHLREDTRQG
jgi:RNA polymerase sigma-70 factor, ECF subfamily